MTQQSGTVALALGSGAARGLAHIGVLRVLQQAGLQVSGIAGCSMGALIGGIYAAGKLGEYEDWVCELTEFDVLRLLDMTWGSRAGLIKGEAVIEALKALIGDHRIEDLPIPFTAVATDLNTRREVWLDSGNLFRAIRASIAIPGIFRPVRDGARLLLDGGLVNPVPMAPTASFSADLVVAVNVMATPAAHPLGTAPLTAKAPQHGYRERIESFVTRVQRKLAPEHGKNADDTPDEPSITDILLESLETMQATITRFKLAAYQPDLLIGVPANVCRAHEFYRAKTVIAAGEYWARRALEDWQARREEQL
jgi:NTE family protein